MKTILLVDDEQRMLDLLELFLSPHGYRCLQATDGQQALELFQKEDIHLVLLDVMMPGMDGWEVCRRLRELSNVPVILLTARSDKSDVVKGLDQGADDYITKPFDERELTARVRVALRRTGDETQSKTIHEGPFTLDLESYSILYDTQEVRLTLKEFYIIEAMMTRPNRTFTREDLLQVAWEYDTYTEVRTVDSHIRNLRDKLRKSNFPIEEILVTVWGIGYKWR
ncbi:DNA-binding response regulator [Sporosarcina sp. P3]|uniref:response regulator transcription factor n=1 Tax=Sporosarcina TaxID=1569 RepID=UPI0009DC6041|nr:MULTISPECIES: response regulator transcription factor [Sporosarcina]ARF16075.1 DNA-binding response regulator [Sporosarcina ureae]PID23203.1 DNA-binding response regulator [Sporosarcina sp. P3]